MTFYTTTDPDELTHDNIGDAIAEYLDATEPEEWVRRVEVYRYEPMKVSDAFAKASALILIEGFLEDLDDEYSSDSGYPSKPTPEMLDAARAFVDAVVSRYEVNGCERTGVETVDLVELLTENPGQLAKQARLKKIAERVNAALERMSKE